MRAILEWLMFLLVLSIMPISVVILAVYQSDIRELIKAFILGVAP